MYKNTFFAISKMAKNQFLNCEKVQFHEFFCLKKAQPVFQHHITTDAIYLRHFFTYESPISTSNFFVQRIKNWNWEAIFQNHNWSNIQRIQFMMLFITFEIEPKNILCASLNINHDSRTSISTERKKVKIIHSSRPENS